MLSLDRQNALRALYRQTHPNWQPATDVYAAVVRRHIRPHWRILDLGCGRGGLVEQLEHPSHQVMGIDADFLSLREHRLDLPRAAASSATLPFADCSFDMVLASWFLEHLGEPLLTFQEIGRVLRSGGVFAFITPNARHPLARVNQLLGRFARLQGRIVERIYGRAAADAFRTCYRANTAAVLVHLSRHSQFRVEHLEAIADPTYVAFTPLLFRWMSWLEDRLPVSHKLHLVGCLRRQG